MTAQVVTMSKSHRTGLDLHPCQCTRPPCNIREPVPCCIVLRRRAYKKYGHSQDGLVDLLLNLNGTVPLHAACLEARCGINLGSAQVEMPELVLYSRARGTQLLRFFERGHRMSTNLAKVPTGYWAGGLVTDH